MKYIKRILSILMLGILSNGLVFTQVVPEIPGGNGEFSSFSDFIFPVPVPKNGTTKDIIPPSPKVASLGIFGQIPVGNFTGTATIPIPIYSINYKELSVPISISYNTLGNKPDIFPGPVGMGWGLQAGGMITRKVNSTPDRGGIIPVDHDYIRVDTRQYNDWYDNKYYSNIRAFEFFGGRVDPDEFNFNINGQTGSFYINSFDESYEDYSIMVKSEQGEFFKVVWHKRMDLNYVLFPAGKPAQLSSYHIQQLYSPYLDMRDYQYNKTIEINNWINGFTMIDSRGIRYNFGNPNSAKEYDNAIEFSRLGHDYYSFQTEFYDVDVYYNTVFKKFVQANTWHLTSIESPNGYCIKFNYQREYYVTKFRFTDYSFTWKNNWHLTLDRNAQWADAFRRVFINGSFLTEIEFPDGKVEFKNSVASGQLEFAQRAFGIFGEEHATSYKIDRGHLNRFFYYPDIRFANTDKIYGYPSEPYLPHKVDKVLVYDQNNLLIRSVNFDYTNGYERLKLLSLTILGTNGGEAALKYKFEYDSTPLPEYTSNMTDYYGFYNAKKLYEGFESGDLLYTDQIYFDTLKAPDFNFAKAEILTKITYPTGGYSIMKYEPHGYGKVYQAFPHFNVRNASQSLDITIADAGGLRIERVENYDKNDNLINSKRYIYKTDDGVSSGILAYGRPDYVDNNGPSGHFRISTSPNHPMTASYGNHVTYTQVKIEEGTGDGANGYTVYKYKNFDNGFADKPLKGYSNSYPTSYNLMMEGIEGISMKLERGQPISEEIFDTTGNIVKRTNYLYNDNLLRFNQNVRYYRKLDGALKLKGENYTIITAGENYTYHSYLKEKTDELFFESGGSIVTTTNYTYNEQYRLLKTTQITDSRGDLLKNEITYPFDKINTPVYASMTDRYMLNYPIETVSKRNNETVVETKTEYKENITIIENDTLILPHKYYVKRGNSPMRLESTYNEYDKIGNHLSITDNQTDDKICYLWSYKGSYPVAKIVGFDYTDVIGFIGGQTAVDNLWNKSNPTQEEIETIRTTLTNAGALVTSYTYKPAVGMMTQTDFRGITTYYEYDGLGRLTEIKVGKKDTPDDTNVAMKSVETYDYNYKTNPATIISYSINNSDFSITVKYLGCSDLIQNAKIMLNNVFNANPEYELSNGACTGSAVIPIYSYPVAYKITVILTDNEGNEFDDFINIYIPE